MNYSDVIFKINSKILIDETGMYDEYNDYIFESLKEEYTLDNRGRLTFKDEE